MDVQGQESNFYWCQGRAKISTSLYSKCFLHRHEYHQVQGRDSMCHRLFNWLVPRTCSTLSALCRTTPSKSLHVCLPRFPHLQNSCNTYCIRAITWGCCHFDKWLRDPWIDDDLTYKCIFTNEDVFYCYEYCVLQAACVINLMYTKIQSKLFKTLKKTLLCVHSDRLSVDSAYTHAQIISRVIRV